MRRKVVAELIQGHRVAVTNNIAELPWRHAESPLDVVAILELLDELVENLTRFLSLKTDQARDVVATRHVQVRAIKGRHDSRLGEFTLGILSRVDVEGNLFIGRKNVRERDHAMRVGASRSSRASRSTSRA